VGRDLARAERADRGKPEEHDRSEDGAELAGPSPLNEKECREHDARERDDPGLERRRRDRDPLHRREDGDRRGDDPVPIEERRAGDHHSDDERKARDLLRPRRVSAPAGRWSGVGEEREEGEDPPFTLVVGAHHEADVLHAHDQRERPQDEREHPEHVARRRVDAGLGGNADLEGIERARSDVAEDDPESAQRESGRRRLGMARFLHTPSPLLPIAAASSAISSPRRRASRGTSSSSLPALASERWRSGQTPS